MELRKRRRDMHADSTRPKKLRIALMDDAEANNSPGSSDDALLSLSDDSNDP